MSLPVRLALEDHVISESTSLFDYGCGHGEDLGHLQDLGINCSGWDPVFRVDTEKAAADVVNLGYVINVIEDHEERAEVLKTSWALAKQAMVVSARSTIDSKGTESFRECRDGLLSSRGTFQKFYKQPELRAFIDQTLGTQSVPAAPGIFYVFRDQEERHRFLASRYRRSVRSCSSQSLMLFEEHKELLGELSAFFLERGRLPAAWELPTVDEIDEVFGSLKRAFLVIRRVTGSDYWESVKDERASDLRVYLAVARLDGRPRFTELPSDMQLDVRAFFSTYKKACASADELLFAAGDRDYIEDHCRNTDIGKVTPAALYVHKTALTELSPVLRVLEGCARNYLGVVDEANLIKIYLKRPQVSYLAYPEFDKDPHPRLFAALTVHLDTLRVRLRRYKDSENPPILHRKELFVSPEYPLYERFQRLTKQEERHGLFARDASTIGNLEAWAEWVESKSFYYRGHRLMRR